jgi:hypothetical protein
MQFKVASVLALAATASAWASSNVSYTTEVVTAFTTYCPEATTLSFNGQNYTVTESTTLTITNCPCTVSKPVYTTSSVVCTTCAPTTAPVYSNTTSPASTAPTVPLSTGATSASATPTPSTITSNGGKVMAVSGAGLAALLGLAAYVL